MKLLGVILVIRKDNWVFRSMSKTVKYLNLLVLLTFLVGQVQYAYSVYFCTMLQAPVPAPTMKMSSAEVGWGNTCDHCSSATQTLEGEQLAQVDCVRLITSQKSTLGSFTESQKLIQHIMSVSFVGNRLLALIEKPLSTTCSLIPTTSSPPSDISIFDSNLRI